jgi:hypothetical protein
MPLTHVPEELLRLGCGYLNKVGRMAAMAEQQAHHGITLTDRSWHAPDLC